MTYSQLCSVCSVAFAALGVGSTVESRFFEPIRESKIGLKNRSVREIGSKINLVPRVDPRNEVGVKLQRLTPGGID